jgi:hypothetical protein
VFAKENLVEQNKSDSHSQEGSIIGKTRSMTKEVCGIRTLDSQRQIPVWIASGAERGGILTLINAGRQGLCFVVVVQRFQTIN